MPLRILILFLKKGLMVDSIVTQFEFRGWLVMRTVSTFKTRIDLMVVESWHNTITFYLKLRDQMMIGTMKRFIGPSSKWNSWWSIFFHWPFWCWAYTIDRLHRPAHNVHIETRELLLLDYFWSGSTIRNFTVELGRIGSRLLSRLHFFASK